MKLNSKLTLMIHIVESFFTTWALMKAARLEPGNILTGIFFLLSFFLYRRIHYRLNDKPFMKNSCTQITSAVIAVLYTLLYMAVDAHHYIETLTSRLFRSVVLLAVFLGFFILFYQLLLLLFSYSGNKEPLHRYFFVNENTGKDFCCRFFRLSRFVNGLLHFYRKHSGLCAFLLCMLCWLPYFLYQYPGIMTPDSINQFEQVLSLIPYSNHHPLAHTMVIKLFYNIGLLFTENKVIAISFYTFFQMCFMAFSVSYFIRTLELFRIRPLVRFILTLFYALVPYHAVFSVTIWKDIMFAGAVLLFTCTLLRFLLGMRKSTVFMFIFTGIMLCLFRSNGWYGFLLCTPFLLYFYRKKAKVIFPSMAAILLTAIVIKYPVMNYAHVIQPDLIESLSIPTQQIAAVICNDRELTEEQLSLIENVVDLTYIKDLYNPTYADNMKELVRAGNQSYLSSHKKEFLKLYIELGLSYPGDYLKAYIDQTYGYWYPDSFYLVAEAEGVSATSLGVSHTPLIRGPLVVKTKEIAIKLGSMLPVYSLLWSMGVIFWILIFCVGNAFVRKEKAKLIYYLPSLALYLTVMIATPVATEFRYVYFMVFSLPLYVMSAILEVPTAPSTKTPEDAGSADC
ncbi:MAG: DUF6020 family protein [Suilimivivens sp.]